MHLLCKARKSPHSWKDFGCILTSLKKRSSIILLRRKRRRNCLRNYCLMRLLWEWKTGGTKNSKKCSVRRLNRELMPRFGTQGIFIRSTDYILTFLLRYPPLHPNLPVEAVAGDFQEVEAVVGQKVIRAFNCEIGRINEYASFYFL